MEKMPGYLGPMAFGIKMGVIAPGMNLEELLFEALNRCNRDGLLKDGDILCITESIVARAQNNFVTVDDVAREIKDKLSLPPDGRVGVVFPITSRNRFVQILRGIARAVPQGEVIIQFSFPCDEVGNQLIDPEFVERLGKTECDAIEEADLEMCIRDRADIICGLLETYDIPTRREYTGPYKGLKVVFGQEIGVVIMVPEKLWATAREVITSNNDPQPDK